MTDKPEIAAHFAGVDVPASPFLNPKRIERINAGRYEGQEIAGAQHLVQPGDKVMEMGAGLGIVGAVSVAAKKGAKLLSFEANPSLIPHIRSLYALNRLKSRAEVRNQVLISAPDRPSTLPFAVHNSYLGSSLTGDPDRALKMVDVETADFNAVAQKYQPNVMLMDIEGGELEVLQHADLAALKSLRGLVIEFHPDQYGVSGMKKTKNVLREAGFARIDDLSTRTVWIAERQVADGSPA